LRLSAGRGERRCGNDPAQATRPWSFHQHHAADRCTAATADPLRASNTSTSIAKINRRWHCMRKWCAATKVKRHLRRLMRSATCNITERTLHERDLLLYRREESSDIRFT
jgi:hypothetical protein